MAGKAGRSGRPPKPLEQHARAGTLRADRHVPLGSLQDVLPAGDGWRKDPLVVLEDVVSAGVDWLARTDEVMLVMLREALKLYERATNAGSLRDQIAAQQNVVSMLSELGFSPTARARLGLAKVATLEGHHQGEEAYKGRRRHQG